MSDLTTEEKARKFDAAIKRRKEADGRYRGQRRELGQRSLTVWVPAPHYGLLKQFAKKLAGSDRAEGAIRPLDEVQAAAMLDHFLVSLRLGVGPGVVQGDLVPDVKGVPGWPISVIPDTAPSIEEILRLAPAGHFDLWKRFAVTSKGNRIDLRAEGDRALIVALEQVQGGATDENQRALIKWMETQDGYVELDAILNYQGAPFDDVRC